MVYSKLSGIKRKAGRIGIAGRYNGYDVFGLHEKEETACRVVCLDRESPTVMPTPRSGGIEPGTMGERKRRDAI
jgi:hypothetical protein